MAKDRRQPPRRDDTLRYHAAPQEQHVIDARPPRARRWSFDGPRMSWGAISAVVAVLGLLIVIAGGIVAGATAFGGKADAGAVEQVRAKVGEIEKDVGIIKYQVGEIHRAIRREFPTSGGGIR